MPDQELMAKAMFAGLAAAGGVLLLVALLARRRPAAVAAGSALAVGLGFPVGVVVLGLWPKWPPTEDDGRFLLVLLPAAVLVELLAAVPRLPRGLAWLGRGLVAAAAAPVLLHGSVYVSGDGPRRWSPAESAATLAGLAAALAGAWALLLRLAQKSREPSVPLSLALCSAVAATAVITSGYATGGQFGLPLAGALIGVALAVLLPAGRPAGAVGVGVVSLFALVVVGHYFGELTTPHALLLFFAPLLGWLPELPGVRRVGPWLRGAARVAAVAVPLAIPGEQAYRVILANLRPPAPGAAEISTDDYANFGK